MHARTHMSRTAVKGARKRTGGDTVAGPQARREVAECEYYGTKAITGNFPFALRTLVFFFFHVIPYYPSRGKRRREGTAILDSGNTRIIESAITAF